MAEQQQQVPVAKPSSGSAVVAIAALIAAAGAIVWFGWGDDLKSAAQPAQSTSAPVVAAAKPAEPPKPRPTIFGKMESRPLQPAANGTFNFGGTYCFVIHYSQNWSGVDQQIGFAPEAGYPRQEGESLLVKGTWSPNGASFGWDQTVTKIDAHTLSYDVSLKSATPVPTNALALGINLPPDLYSGQRLIVDGEPVKLPVDPATPANAIIFPERIVNTIEIATPTGHITIDGPVPVLVQDNRAYGGDVYYIRLGFTPGSGAITDATLKLKFRQVLPGIPPATPQP